MYIVTKLRKIKPKGNGSLKEEVDCIDYKTILYCSSEAEALSEATRIIRENPHTTPLVFVLNHVFKSKEPAIEHTNMLEA